MSSKVYEFVTQKIIEKLEQGVVPWKKCWNGSEPINYVTRKPYRGINTLLLDKGGEYLTFKQIQALGGKVKKGEKSTMITFYKISTGKVKEENDEEKERKYFLLRYYNVFHISQTEGIESKIETFNNDSIIEAENIINNFKNMPPVKYGESGAYYSPTFDYIGMPNME